MCCLYFSFGLQHFFFTYEIENKYLMYIWLFHFWSLFCFPFVSSPLFSNLAFLENESEVFPNNPLSKFTPKALWIWTPPSAPDTPQHERKANLSVNKMKQSWINIRLELPGSLWSCRFASCLNNPEPFHLKWISWAVYSLEIFWIRPEKNDMSSIRHSQ